MKLTVSALREDFSLALFVGKDVDDDLRELLLHGVNQAGIIITDPRKSVDQFHTTSVEACEALIDFLLGVYDLNYVGHCYYVSKDSTRERKAREREDSDALAKWKE